MLYTVSDITAEDTLETLKSKFEYAVKAYRYFEALTASSTGETRYEMNQFARKHANAQVDYMIAYRALAAQS